MSNQIEKISVQNSSLNGTVKVSGAKNSVLRLMAATLLSDEPISITNYPSTLLDAVVHADMLKVLGKEINISNDILRVHQVGPIENILKWEGRSIRNTLLILGALLSKTGKGAVPLPGGCDIGSTGARAYNLHIMLMEKFGAKISSKDGYLHAEAPIDGLKAAEIHLPIRSTGATENSIIIASLVKGITRVWNPHIRPEILDLIDFLKSMGAKIQVFGQEYIEIEGVEKLSGTSHKVIPDNVEALTWLVGAAITNGNVEIIDFPFEHLEVPMIFLRESGANVYRNGRNLIVKGSKCYPLEISTGPYPGINSDMQPILAVFAMMSKGQSKFIDLRFPGRYGYADELAKMGVKRSIDENLLIINGNNSIVGNTVTALDLRAGIALALAGLVAEGETIIEDAWQITRGYDRFIEKMNSLGGKVNVVDT